MSKIATINRTKSIVDTALDVAEKAARANFINVCTADDRSHVTITTVVDQRELAWIEYDADQLDELIRVLCAHRGDLTGKR